jgi:hypothetical protein
VKALWILRENLRYHVTAKNVSHAMYEARLFQIVLFVFALKVQIHSAIFSATCPAMAL